MALATRKECEFTPREYQVELLHKSLQKNIIVCLGTGTGKTFIGVMLIKELLHEILKPYKDGGKRTFFITKTVPLVAQQAEVLRNHTGLNVGSYTGAMGVDFWQKEKWEEEFIKNQVLVMTNQILVNIVSQVYLQPKSINLLIIDECHHAVGNDPVVQIMRRFLDFTEKPKILGLTASVLNGKAKTHQVEKKIRELERALSSVVETPTKTAEAFATNPNEKIVIVHGTASYQDQMEYLYVYLTSILKTLTVPADESEDSFLIDDDDEDDWFLEMIGPSIKLTNIMKDLQYVLVAMGMWPMYEVALQLQKELRKIEEQFPDQCQERVNIAREAVIFVAETCKTTFQRDCTSDLEALRQFTSPKVQRLLEVLTECHKYMSERQTIDPPTREKQSSDACPLRGIVFTDRRVAAWILSHYLQKVSEWCADLNFIKADCIMGHGCDPSQLKYATLRVRQQRERISNFRLGMTNILVGTRVVEEGIDVPKCNVVVRFDEPKDFRSYVQSKGRARSKDSYFILLVSQDESSQIRNDIELYKTIEKTLYAICHERQPVTEEESAAHLLAWILPPYYAGDKEGPSVSAVDAIQRVNWYCQLLPTDKLTCLVPRVLFKSRLLPRDAESIQHLYADPENFDVQLYFEDSDFADEGFFEENELPRRGAARDMEIYYQCGVKLPINSPIKDFIVGDLMPNKKFAKQSVALKLCKILHEAGELNDNLLPVHKDPTEFLKQFTDIEEEEVLLTSKPGSKKRRNKYQKQIATSLKGTPIQPNQPLFLYRFEIVAKPVMEGYHCPEVGSFSSNASCFGILTTAPLPEIEPFPLHTRKLKLWVKISLVQDCICCDKESDIVKLKLIHEQIIEEILKIPMNFMVSCNELESNTFVEANYLLVQLANIGSEEDPAFHLDPVLSECSIVSPETLPNEKTRKLFNFDHSAFTDAAIKPLHRENCDYYVVEKIHDKTSPLTPFPKGGNLTFMEYYNQTYNIKIQRLDQPLLEAKWTRPCLNMLPQVQPRTKVSRMIFNGKEIPRAEFYIPELCGIAVISKSLLLQAQCLPSILYRLNSLLLADELAQCIFKNAPRNVDCFPHSKWSNYEEVCQVEALNCPSEYSWERMHCKEQNMADTLDLLKDTPPTSMVLKTLIPCAANDFVNLERLEIIGDSFLKYATSIYLFCQFPKIDEGRLTLARSKIVSNSHLYHLAKRTGLSNLVHTETFSPQSNWLPSNYCTNKWKEEKLIDAKVPWDLWQYAPDKDFSNWSIDEIWTEIKAKHASEKGSEFPVEMPDDDENVFNTLTHRLAPDKSVADSVESLIGAHLLYVGPDAALRFLTWVGVKILPQSTSNADDESQVFRPLDIPQTAYFHPKHKASTKLLAGLEQFQLKIGYYFKDVSFLLQAVTHPSYSKNMVTDCYQRLEFLGDAVLDYLVTWNLFKNEKNFSPGDITDLRSALVNNETFAKLAVENGFHHHLKAMSVKLFETIGRYVKYVQEEKMDEDAVKVAHLTSEEEATNIEEIEVPKALGDLFESVAGAIYLDSGLSLDTVWNVYSKMMVPLIDQYTLDIPKDVVREVHEMFPDVVFRKEEIPNEDETVTYRVYVKIIGRSFEGFGKSYKLAKRNCAKQILKIMKTRMMELRLRTIKEQEQRDQMRKEEHRMQTLNDIAKVFR